MGTAIALAFRDIVVFKSEHIGKALSLLSLD